MSRVSAVLKNKDRVEKTQKAQRKAEIEGMRNSAAFKARLYDELKKIDVLLESDEVKSVAIRIPEQFMARFGEAIYSEDLAEYDIIQDQETPNIFHVSHKFVQF